MLAALHRAWTCTLLCGIVALGLAPTASPQAKRTLLQEDIGLVNALIYGVTFDQVTVNAAITAIGSAKRVLFLAAGTWTFNQSVTVPSNITLFIPASTTVQVNAGVTLSLATIPHYDQPYWFTGAGSLRITDATWLIDVRVYGALGDGVSDDTAAITAAITAALVQGGTVLFPCGTFVVTSTIKITNGSNLKILGPTVTRGTIENRCAELRLTAASGSVFHFDGTVGVELAGLTLSYSHGSYADTLLRLNQVSGTAFTRAIYVHDSVLQGTSTSSKNGRLVFLDGTAEVTMERNVFANAATGIEGSSSNVLQAVDVRISNNKFLDSLSTFVIRLGASGAIIDSNRFYGLSNGAGAGFNTTPVGMAGLTYIGNYHNTSNNAGTNYVQSQYGPIRGALISGNSFVDSHASSRCVFLGNSSQGIAVVGNYMVCGISLAAGLDVLSAGNYMGSPVPVSPYPTGSSLVAGSNIATGLTHFGVGPIGFAGGTKVLCVDTSTALPTLYPSSTGTDCSN